MFVVLFVLVAMFIAPALGALLVISMPSNNKVLVRWVALIIATLIGGRILADAGDTDTLENVIAGATMLTFAHEPAVNADGSLADADQAGHRPSPDLRKVIAQCVDKQVDGTLVCQPA